MVERNESRYQLEQDNKIYILTTSILGDKLKLVCQDSNSQIFFGAFNLNDLLRISRYFQSTHSVEQIQKYLNGIIEKQRVSISQNGNIVTIILYLVNNDKINIPLQNITNNYNNQKKNIYYESNNIQGLNNISGGGAQYIYQNNNNQQYLNQQNYLNKIKNNSQYPISNANIYNYQYDNNKIGKLEDDTNIIKVEQEKLKNDMKKVIEEAEKLRKQNEIYKTDQETLSNEKETLSYENETLKKDNETLKNENETLKNENEDYKKQILAYEDENNQLRNQFEIVNKDLDAFENQNKEIRKMYEELENENINCKNQMQQLINDNEMLRQQIEELNNNYTIINNEIESIKNENNILKNNLEEQKKNDKNEEIINKLMEDNNIYKMKAEENELLKKQIEELQYQIQLGQEKQEIDGRESEVKGDIIHDIKELEMITKKINKDNRKLIINLLYKASVDSDRAAAFHQKCDHAKNTIVLVETKNGRRFGGYTTCSWSGNCVDKNDPEAFIFSFDKMKTYDNIPGDEAIGCYPKFGPIFLGCQIKIFDNAFTKGGTTFEKELNFNTEEDYELTGGERTFEVKDIEVYEVIIE
jgi:acetolactate synthase small subunit